jgi:hypothetical protein
VPPVPNGAGATADLDCVMVTPKNSPWLRFLLSAACGLHCRPMTAGYVVLSGRFSSQSVGHVT